MLLSGSPSVSPRSIILRPEDSGNPLSEGLPASDSRRSRPSRHRYHHRRRPHLHHRHRRRLRHHYRRTSARTIGVHNDIAVGIEQGDDVGISLLSISV